MKQLTSLDAHFLDMESPHTYGHVSGLAVLDPSTAPGGRLGLGDLRRLVSERLHLLPPFRWRLVGVPLGLDHPYWVEDPHFDLDFHLRETAVAPPGGPRQLAELVSRVVARPLDRAHPLWELYLVHGVQDDRVALLTKIHHSVVDGVSGAEILSILLDLSPEGREVPPPGDEVVGEPVPGQLEMLGRGLLGLPRQPLRMLGAVPKALPDLDQVPEFRSLPGVPTLSRVASAVPGLRRASGDGGVLEGRGVSAPRTRFNNKISPHRRFAFGDVSLEAVKAIKDELGIKVNDVVVALCATMLRDWLLERDELPAEPLVALIPHSVRTQEQMGTFGNRISFMVVPIPTDEPDPRRRLLRTHELLRGVKERHQGVPASLLQDANTFIPPAMATRANRVLAELVGIQSTTPPVNLTISNVPGPPIPLYCAGARLVGQYPVNVLTDGLGLSITCMSYRDGMDFGIVVDRDQVDDAWSMMRGLERALDELCDVVCGRRLARRDLDGAGQARAAAPSGQSATKRSRASSASGVA